MHNKRKKKQEECTNSVVGIATGFGLDGRGFGVRVPLGAKFSLIHDFHVGSGVTQPLIQWVPREISSGIKRRGREANHSTLTSAKLKNMWIYTSTSPYVFMA